MKNPAVLVSRLSRLHEHSSAAWGLELVLRLHDQPLAQRYLFQNSRPFPEDDFAPAQLERVRTMGIELAIESYGPDFARFEADLRSKRNEAYRFPLVRIPVVAQFDLATAGLHIRPGTFITGEENGQPVFLTRTPRSRTVTKVSLTQLRFWHDAWRHWPAVLPSMLLTVLWHRRARE
jgi:hypothetical protein